MPLQAVGRYEILAELGRGGMATVYRARDPRFDREVAIKVLPREFLHDPTFRTRFEREAKAIAALEHPAIVPVYDFGQDRGRPYLVMRYMPGGSLAQRLEESSLSLEEAAYILGQLGSALEEAHRKDIIHRDLKPANILFDQIDNAYLSDFGIARLADATTSLTGSGVVGTPWYLAPEMAVPGGLSPLVDIYALGVTLFQMLTGHVPYEADTPVGVLMAHVTQPIPDVRALRPDLPEAVQVVIEGALAKDPHRRYQSAVEMAADLQKALGTTPRAPIRPATSEAPASAYVETSITNNGIPPVASSGTPAPPPAPAHILAAPTADIEDQPAARQAPKKLRPLAGRRKVRGTARRISPMWFGGAMIVVALLVTGGVALTRVSGRPTARLTGTPLLVPVGDTATVTSIMTNPPTDTLTATRTATTIPTIKPTASFTPNLDATATANALLTQAALSLTPRPTLMLPTSTPRLPTATFTPLATATSASLACPSGMAMVEDTATFIHCWGDTGFSFGSCGSCPSCSSVYGGGNFVCRLQEPGPVYPWSVYICSCSLVINK